MITRVDVPVRVNEMNVTGWLSEKAQAVGGQDKPTFVSTLTDEPESTSSAERTPVVDEAVEEGEERERLPPPLPEMRTA
jgi:hypothetical protein